MIYVMWSREARLSKVGTSGCPSARVHGVRRQRFDDSIELMAQWDFRESGALSEIDFESMIHRLLDKAGLCHRGQRHNGEWFAIRWPAAAAIIEQFAYLLGAAGDSHILVPWPIE
jgi:hypothetical protein